MTRERVYVWFDDLANNYLRWRYEQSIKGAPTCPDCGVPEPVCYCDEKRREDEYERSIYEAGRYDEALEARNA